MDTESTFGPSDPDLWLKRPLGYWEAQLMVNWPPGVPGKQRIYIMKRKSYFHGRPHSSKSR